VNSLSDIIAAFDWLEEFRANEGRTDGMPALREDALSVPLQLPARTLPEVIALPGGCVLTAKQYKELEGFRKNVLVNKWYVHMYMCITFLISLHWGFFRCVEF